MYAAEFFVTYVQRFLPTPLVLWLVRWYMYLFVGWQLRGGAVVSKQIAMDRKKRKERPVTTDVEVTNEQLYANDPGFFLAHLGPLLKYSSCEWPTPSCTLAEAERYTVRLYQDKAGLADLPAGSRVLELGCGWGSLSLSNAERFPELSFVSFSNSPPQIDHITREAEKRGLRNIRVSVEDYAVFVDPTRSKVAPAGAELFDAALGIETVEHAQNIEELLGAVALRLKPGAKFFVQSLLHQSASYLMKSDSWMGRNFFTGGSIIALNSYFHLCPPSLRIEDVIPVDGREYTKTLLAWLALQESRSSELVSKYGRTFYEGFRMFYASCAEAFGANEGNEFMVGYYVFRRVAG